MVNKGLLAGGLVIVAVTGAGAYLAVRKPPPTTSPYVITLSGPSSGKVDATLSYTVNLTSGGKAVSGQTITLYAGKTKETSILDLNGNASFNVTFSSAGSYSLYGEYSGAKSNTLTVTILSVSPTCASCSDCPDGYNCVGGKCVQLIPTNISVPVTVNVPSAYIEMVSMQNFDTVILVSTINTIVINKTATKVCPTWPQTNSTSYTTSIGVNGTVKDSSGRGVNGIPVDASVNGGGSFNFQSKGGSTFSGKATSSMKNGSTSTDCNGNFTLNVDITIDLSYKEATFFGIPSGDENTSWYAIPINPFTLTVSSGALSTQTTLIEMNDFLSHERCNYEFGILG